MRGVRVPGYEGCRGAGGATVIVKIARYPNSEFFSITERHDTMESWEAVKRQFADVEKNAAVSCLAVTLMAICVLAVAVYAFFKTEL